MNYKEVKEVAVSFAGAAVEALPCKGPPNGAL